MLKQVLRSLLMPALLALICASFPAAQAAPGDLDTTFAGFGAGGGVSETGLSMFVTVYETQNGMTLQPDGKMVTVGYKGRNLIVFRYLPNGQRDRTFSGDGKIEIPAPEIAGSLLRPYDITFQPDGGIIVVGGIRLGDDDDDYDFLLVRLTASGELDPSFGDLGFVTTNFNGNEDRAHAVLVQPNGAIVVCGEVEVDSLDPEFGVARYLPNGAPDPTFSNDGRTTIGFRDDARCHNLALQGDGKLVLVGAGIDQPFGTGAGDYDFAIARLEINGSLDDDSNDAGFSGDGKVLTDFGEEGYAWDVALRPDGKIVVLGNSAQHEGSTRDSYLARYLPNGAIDGTFGSGGKKTIPGDVLYALALQPDGKLLALGTHHFAPGDGRFAFHRLDQNGAPDPTFGAGGDGIVWHGFGGDDVGRALALLPDGRILGFGWSGGSKLILVRLWPNGYLDQGGQQTHKPVIPPIFDLASGADAFTSALAVQTDGKLLVAGQLRRPGAPPFGDHSAAFVTRFLAGGQVDATFGPSGQGTALVEQPFTNFVARALALQPDGKIVIAGSYQTATTNNFDFMVARFHPNGVPDNTFGGNGANYRLANFSSGASVDLGYALALAPDGKIVVAGAAWNGSRQVWGVARWNSTGAPDATFNGTAGPGKAFLDFGPGSTAKAVLVQPDGKVLLGGKTSGDDFAVARLLESGAPDPGFGPNHDGSIITDMGGVDAVTALAANGWIYAGGYSWRGGADDFALAQYRPDGTLAECASGQTCNHWRQGKRYVSLGGSDSAYALVLREDNQLVVAGCSDWHFAAAQVNTTDVNAPALEFETDFVGDADCAFGVQFSNAGQTKFVLAGQQTYANDTNIALARFETTENNPLPSPTPTPPPGSNVYPVYLPIVVR